MPVPDSPTFRLLFDGLLVLAVNQNDNLCEFGVVNAPDHTLRIEVEKIDADRQRTSLPEFSHDLPSEGDIQIDAPKSALAMGVQFFRDLTKPFQRLIDVDDAQDFRWLVDLEGAEFHNQKLSLKPDFPSQRIIVPRGLFYTHDLIQVQLVRPDGSVLDSAVASPIGCNLDLNVGEEFVLPYGPDIQNKVLIAEKGVTYVIKLLNNPKADQHSVHNGGGQLNDLSTHFHFYYDEAVEVGRAPKFDIKVRPEDGEALGPNRPCGGTELGQHTDGFTG